MPAGADPAPPRLPHLARDLRGAPGAARRDAPAALARRLLTPRFYTVGHSTHPLEAFAALVAGAGARFVVDVRTLPRSRKNPQYNTDVLPGALAAHGLGYRHIAALGGLRSRTKTVPPEVNAFWQNRSFHNYADYAMSEAFRSGLDELLQIGVESPCAIMCAEGLWWRCHRRIIADYLLAAGKPVSHILPGGEVAPAELTEAARRTAEGVLRYPAADLLSS